MFEDIDFIRTLLPSFAVRMAVSLVCGLILGIEREWKDKPAGLRTIVLITAGSTLFMIVSELIPQVAEGPESVMRIDPGRIAAGVVSGIGFLGAGTIIQARGVVHGLTTAAVIWVAAAIGLCIGIGFPLLAIGVTLVVVTVLVLMRPLRDWLSRRGASQTLTFTAPDDSLKLRRIWKILSHQGVREGDLSIRRAGEGRVEIEAVHHASGGSEERLLAALSSIEGVLGASEFQDEEFANFFPRRHGRDKV